MINMEIINIYNKKINARDDTLCLFEFPTKNDIYLSLTLRVFLFSKFFKINFFNNRGDVIIRPTVERNRRRMRQVQMRLRMREKMLMRFPLIARG